MLTQVNLREQLCVEIAELEAAIQALVEELCNLSPSAEAAVRRQLRVLEAELAETAAWQAAERDMKATSSA